MEEVKKKVGNELFGEKKFAEAEKVYSEAISNIRAFIEKQELDGKSNWDSLDEEVAKSLTVFLTNRAAARLQLSLFDDALNDASEAIKYDKSWLKAYVRKASAHESLGDVHATYLTWLDASTNCEPSAYIKTQLKNSKSQWIKSYLNESYPIKSISDLCDRFKLLPNKRERLSLIVHFWNDSTPNERMEYFRLLLSIIGGEGGSPASIASIKEENMTELSVAGYPDLPRSRYPLTTRKLCNLTHYLLAEWQYGVNFSEI